jgi:hypothetical protein
MAYNVLRGIFGGQGLRIEIKPSPKEPQTLPTIPESTLVLRQ